MYMYLLSKGPIQNQSQWIIQSGQVIQCNSMTTEKKDDLLFYSLDRDYI